MESSWIILFFVFFLTWDKLHRHHVHENAWRWREWFNDWVSQTVLGYVNLNQSILAILYYGYVFFLYQSYCAHLHRVCLMSSHHYCVIAGNRITTIRIYKLRAARTIKQHQWRLHSSNISVYRRRQRKCGCSDKHVVLAWFELQTALAGIKIVWSLSARFLLRSKI